MQYTLSEGYDLRIYAGTETKQNLMDVDTDEDKTQKFKVEKVTELRRLMSPWSTK